MSNTRGWENGVTVRTIPLRKKTEVDLWVMWLKYNKAASRNDQVAEITCNHLPYNVINISWEGEFVSLFHTCVDFNQTQNVLAHPPTPPVTNQNPRCTVATLYAWTTQKCPTLIQKAFCGAACWHTEICSWRPHGRGERREFPSQDPSLQPAHSDGLNVNTETLFCTKQFCISVTIHAFGWKPQALSAALLYK